jgi:nicotinamide-nucleotide amidase
MFVDDPLLTDDARGLVADLTIRKQSVATAESLTGGLLAATIAGVAGASEVLRGGLITYTEDTKVALAGLVNTVPPRWSSCSSAARAGISASRRCASRSAGCGRSSQQPD